MTPNFHCDREGCRLSGELVLGQLDQLSAVLLQHAKKNQDMSLDMQQVSDCDSSFIATLVACLQIKKRHQKQLKISACPEKMLELIKLYGLAGCGIEIV